MVMMDISGDRGSLVGLANKRRASWLQVVAGAWMGIGGEGERGRCELLTHGASSSSSEQ